MSEQRPWQPEVPDYMSDFVNRLSKLDRGECAILRRNAGLTIAESRGALGLFYRLLPSGIGTGREEIFFLVATLYPLNERRMSGDFGQTIRTLKQKTGRDSLDRRMAILLDSQFDLVGGRTPGGGELAFRLRQAVKLAAGHEIGIDWPLLLRDLTWWTDPDRRVQKRWARSYFRTEAIAETKGGDL